MLNPATSFQEAIIGDNLKIAELYEIALSNGTTLYYTTHSEQVVWGNPSRIYNSVPIERNHISNNINLEMDTVEISLQNITGELFDEIYKNVLDAATITIKLINWEDSYAPDLETILYVGTADVEFDRRVLKLACKSLINSLNVVIPRQLYQEPCNHTLFDSNCNLKQSANKHSGVVTTASLNKLLLVDNNIKVNINGANPSDITLYNLGEIHATSGNNEGQRRMIRVAIPSNILVMTPFSNAFEVGDTYDAYPGCDKRVAETCDAVFSNEANFLGFIFVPQIQDT